jgi:hypothetical protein
MSCYAQISKALVEYPTKPSVHKMDKYKLAVLDEKLCLVEFNGRYFSADVKYASNQDSLQEFLPESL